MDLSKLSNEELLGLYNKKSKLSSLSDDELLNLYKKDLPVIEEQHQDISTLERANLKNFANSPEAIVETLKANHPDLEVKENNGKILIKRPEETQYKVLDPDTGFFSKDFLKDTLDVGYDIGSGIAETGAATLGGIAGSLVAPGAGTAIGAVTAGGASSAASEALRQAIGKATGIKQDISGSDVVMAGALGVGGTALLGGGVGKNAVKGLLPKAASSIKNNVAPLVFGAVNKISTSTFKKAAKNPGFEKAIGEGLDSTVGEVASAIVNGAESELRQAGKAIKKNVVDSGKQIYVGNAKKLLRDEIDILEEKDTLKGLSEYEHRQLGNYNELYQNIFRTSQSVLDNTGKKSLVYKEIPSIISPEDAFNIRHALGEIMDTTGNPDLPTFNKIISSKAKNLYHKLNESISKVTPEAPVLNKKYVDAINYVKDVRKNFEAMTPDQTNAKVFNALTSPDTRTKTMLKRAIKTAEKKTGKDINKTSADLKAFDEITRLGNQWLAPSIQGGVISGVGYMAGSGMGGAGSGRMGATAAIGLGALSLSPRAAIGLLKGMNKAGSIYEQYLKKPSILGTSVFTNLYQSNEEQTRNNK